MQIRSKHIVVALAAICSITPTLKAAPDLLVSDQDVVRRFNGQTGATVNANFIPLQMCTGVAIGPDSNVYVATDNPPVIYRYNPVTGAQIGAGPFVDYLPPGSTNPDNVIIPEGMHFGPGGKLYVADAGGDQNVHIYNPDGTSNRALNSLSPTLLAPTSVAFDQAGNVYVANQNGANILKYNSGPDNFTEFVPVLSGGLVIPTDLTFGADQKLYVVDGQSATAKILRYNSDGSFDQKLVDYSTGFFTPWGITFGPDGDFYVSGTDAVDGGEVLRYQPNGTFDGVFVSGLTYPTFLTFIPEPTGLLAALGTIAFLRRKPRRI